MFSKFVDYVSPPSLNSLQYKRILSKCSESETVKNTEVDLTKRISTGLCQMQGILLNYLMHRPINGSTHAHIPLATPPELAYSLFLQSHTCASHAVPMCALKGEEIRIQYFLLTFLFIVIPPYWQLNFRF